MFVILFLISQAFAGEEAIDKAREAAMIQFGVTKIIDNAKTYAKSQVKIHKEIVLAAGIYKIVKEKAVEFKISQDTVKISTNSVGYVRCF